MENTGNKCFTAVIACLLLLLCSSSYISFFPELYEIIVKLSTSDWKILIRQIKYESPDSGIPIFAIFIAGKYYSYRFCSNKLNDLLIYNNDLQDQYNSMYSSMIMQYNLSTSKLSGASNAPKAVKYTM